MIETYSRTLLSPFTGVVQVAETAAARALSLDGRSWAIQYSLAHCARPAAPDTDAQYALVATVTRGGIRHRPLAPSFDPAAVHRAVETLAEAVAGARLPFPPRDRYEYWLLDADEGRPLALLHSAFRAGDTAGRAPRASWVAMPAAQLEVPAPEPAGGRYVPPVNYRLQQAVEERAGDHPRAAWFDRATSDPGAFPPCLVREDWPRDEHRDLCARYVERLAPRLLMRHDLPRTVRARLERAARRHALEVERFHALYPEVLDGALLAQARVEARLRRAGGP